MLEEDMIQPQEQLEIELGLSNPIASPILDFCDDIADRFPDIIWTSEVSSCFGGGGGGGGGVEPPSCYDDNSFIAPSAFSPLPSMDPSTFSAMLDSAQPPPDDIAAVVTSYSPSQAFLAPPTYLANQPDQCHKAVLADANTERYTEYSPNSAVQLLAGPLPQLPPPPAYEEECLPPMSTVSAYAGLDLSSFVGAGIVGGGGGGGGGLYMGGGTSLSEGQQGLYQGGMKLGSEETGMAPMDMAVGGGGIGFYGQCFSSTDPQMLGDTHQHLVGSCGSPNPLVGCDISALDESSYKVGRLTVEERKERIHRYIKKRNERNFGKKIKYACRKTLADNRPRVRGRFAKNDEYGEAARPNSSIGHEFDDHEEVVVKEDDTFNLSDIFANISGVNSFQYNYTIESWI